MLDQNLPNAHELYTDPPAQEVKKIIIEVGHDGTLNYSIDSRLCLWESLGVLDVISQSLKNNHIDTPARSAIAEIKYLIENNINLNSSDANDKDQRYDSLIESLQSAINNVKKTKT